MSRDEGENEGDTTWREDPPRGAGPVGEEPAPAGADNVVAFPTPADDDGRPVPMDLLVPAIEACLFAVGGVCSVGRLSEALGVGEAKVERGLEELRERLYRTGSGLRLVPVGTGWQLRTEPRLASWVAAARGGKPVKLSKAAVETLAVVAFRQPVSKGVVDDVRGVDSGGVLRALSDRGLVRVVGRSDEPGRPLTWGTTPAFLELFGMRSLAELPTLRELRQVDDDPTSAGTPPPGAEEPAVRRLEELLGPPRLVGGREVADPDGPP